MLDIGSAANVPRSRKTHALVRKSGSLYGKLDALI